ncbi:MAG: cytochrome c biosis protein CcmG, thiol:disulfide interchange protein DsbE [Gaiellaceae bacterium]|jgi:cytochrome c biogenesis protein CcmG/thiol:disulfide interchange protein DsbE|nr:cytochrome c biosis protein CcmG, thiol:disulfide interchange protein DsbE [Gaiellaceae bacterium]
MSGRSRLGAQVVAVAVVAALLGLLAWKLAQGESEVTSKLSHGGTPPAPAWTLDRLDGKGQLAIDSLRGKTVVLNFWASWCGPCRDEMPLLQQGSKRWQGKNIVFVGINAKDVRGDARKFLARYSVTYPNVYDGKGSTIGRYGVTGFPETYFIDKTGKVRYRIAGPVRDAADIDGGIERALAPA